MQRRKIYVYLHIKIELRKKSYMSKLFSLGVYHSRILLFYVVSYKGSLNPCGGISYMHFYVNTLSGNTPRMYSPVTRYFRLS